MSIYTGNPIPQVVVNIAQGATYTITPGASETGLWLINGSQTVIMSVGVPFNIVAQGTTIIFQYPNLVQPGNYVGSLYLVNPHLIAETTYNAVFGINETQLDNGVAGTPPTLNSSGSFTTGETAQTFLETGTPNSIVTAQIYLHANNVPFTAQVYLLHPAAITIAQLTSLQLYTSKLGGVDYRFGSDFTLVNADPICTTFNTPNLNLPFVFPVGSTSQLNSAITPIIQPR
jgi:hypothetical protein